MVTEGTRLAIMVTVALPVIARSQVVVVIVAYTVYTPAAVSSPKSIAEPVPATEVVADEP